jgi:predicted transcriptional regulator
MFETMLREMLLKLIREDLEFRDTINILCGQMYDNSVKHAVKYTIDNDGVVKAMIRQMIKQSLEEDGDIQDVIRKQATTDIGELIVMTVREDSSIADWLNDAIAEAIDDKIKDLTFEVSVS